MQDHEYSVIGGFNRAKIGQLIGALAAMISAAMFVLAGWIIEVLRSAGISTPVLVKYPITVALIYFGLYWYFSQEFWKNKKISALLKVPNLAGEWRCIGQSINPDKSLGVSWDGVVSISQTWDKVRIVLKTGQSSSESISASLVHDSTDGYRLMYSYRNTPRITETELRAHLGYAIFLFDRSLTMAEGEYFNGNGRYTFGTMTLVRNS